MKFFVTCMALVIITSACHAQFKLVKDIKTGQGINSGSSPRVLCTTPQGKTYFLAWPENYNGYGLWVTDGTEAGTHLLKGSTSPDHINFLPGRFALLGEQIIVGETEGLWVSDGTTAGTKNLVKTPGRDPFVGAAMYVYKDKAYFIRDKDANTNTELWATDGTTGGTALVKVLSAHRNSPFSPGFYEAFGKLYFTTSKYELWETDGTTSGTVKIPSLAAGYVFPVGGRRKVLYNDKLYLLVNGPGYDALYEYDGTDMKLVKDNLPESCKNMTAAANKMFFVAPLITQTDADIWMSDGTDAGTSKLTFIEPAGYSGSFLFGQVNGKLVFRTQTQAYGHEYWVTDGTPGGTTILKDIMPGGSGAVTNYTEIAYLDGEIDHRFLFKEKFYFAADDGVHGTEVWVTDGTPAGTHMMDEIGVQPGSMAPANIEWIYALYDVLWVTADDGAKGIELYRYEIYPAGIKDEHFSEAVSISPNPNKGSFTISIGDIHYNTGSVQVTDMSGRKVYDNSITQGIKQVQVTLNDVPAGIYMATVQLDGKVISGKVSVE